MQVPGDLPRRARSRTPASAQSAASWPFAGAFGGLAAITALATGVSRKIVVSRLRANGQVCYLCEGRKFVTCRTCGEDKAIEWQPLANPGMRRLCACPTCGGKRGCRSATTASGWDTREATVPAIDQPNTTTSH